MYVAVGDDQLHVDCGSSRHLNLIRPTTWSRLFGVHQCALNAQVAMFYHP